jgi:hypothetical protein
MRALAWVVVVLSGCGGTHVSGYAGTYAASWSGTWQNSTPNTQSGTSTDSATITVTDVSGGELKLTWQVPPNPPSGSITFMYTGSSGTAESGTGVGGNCFKGNLNGNLQTNCCDSCTVTFNGGSFSQPNAGHYTGTTGAGVAYTGTYSGVWTGTRQ